MLFTLRKLLQGPLIPSPAKMPSLWTPFSRLSRPYLRCCCCLHVLSWLTIFTFHSHLCLQWRFRTQMVSCLVNRWIWTHRHVFISLSLTGWHSTAAFTEFLWITLGKICEKASRTSSESAKNDRVSVWKGGVLEGSSCSVSFTAAFYANIHLYVWSPPVSAG